MGPATSAGFPWCRSWEGEGAAYFGTAFSLAADRAPQRHRSVSGSADWKSAEHKSSASLLSRANRSDRASVSTSTAGRSGSRSTDSAPCTLEQRDGERAHAGPHLQHVVVGRKIGQGDDLLQDGVVDKEVLAEREYLVESPCASRTARVSDTLASGDDFVIRPAPPRVERALAGPVRADRRRMHAAALQHVGTRRSAPSALTRPTQSCTDSSAKPPRPTPSAPRTSGPNPCGSPLRPPRTGLPVASLGAPVGVEVRLQAVEERLELGYGAPAKYTGDTTVQLIASVQHLAHAQRVVEMMQYSSLRPKVSAHVSAPCTGRCRVRQRNKLHIVVGAGFLESEAHGLRDARAAPSRPGNR